MLGSVEVFEMRPLGGDSCRWRLRRDSGAPRIRPPSMRIHEPHRRRTPTRLAGGTSGSSRKSLILNGVGR